MATELREKDFYVAPVDPQLRQAGELVESLPAMAYWASDVLLHELETVFRRGWVCVPKQLFRTHNENVRSIQIPTPEDHPHFDVLGMRGGAVKFSLFGESVFFKRSFSPKGAPDLYCFRNRCPHWGYPLEESALDEHKNPRVVCEQHGLTANYDGTFVGHPAFPNPTEEQKKRLCLTRYQLKEWFDLFFVSRTLLGQEPVTSFEETLRPIVESIALLPLDKFQYTKTGPESRVVNGNWKLHAGNYQDWLHIRFIHKKPNGLADSIDLGSAKMEFYNQATLMWTYAINPDDGFDPKDLPDRFRDPKEPDKKRVFALWWFVFPNLTLNFYPWGLSVNVYMPHLDDPEKTEFLWYHYVWDPAKYKDLNTRWLNSQVDFEDVETMRFLGASWKSRSEPHFRGLFGSETEGPNMEKGPHWFHRTVYETMFFEEAKRAAALKTAAR